MSLEQRLAQAREEQAKSVEAQQVEQEQEKLKPIRERVGLLESAESSLKLIQGSLALKSGSKSSGGGLAGKGMVEFSEETKTAAAKNKQKLEVLIDENRDLGVFPEGATPESLGSHPEFSEEQEVKSYMGARQELEGLQESDELLRERLKELGVSLPDGELTYANAEQAIKERISGVQTEIVKEKLTLPERRGEAIEQLAERLKNKLPGVYCSDVRKGGGQSQPFSISFGGYEYSQGRGPMLAFGGDKKERWSNGGRQPFYNWRELNDLHTDSGFNELQKTFGDDVAREVLVEAYGMKSDAAIGEFEEKVAFTSHFKKEFDRISPEKRLAVRAEYDNFNAEAGRLKKVLYQKKAELGKIAGSNRGTDLFDELERLQYFDGEDAHRTSRQNKSILEQIDDHEVDYDRILPYLEKRTQRLKEFIQTLEQAHSPEQARELSFKAPWANQGDDLDFRRGDFGFKKLPMPKEGDPGSFGQASDRFWGEKGSQWEKQQAAKIYLDEEAKHFDGERTQARNRIRMAVEARSAERELGIKEGLGPYEPIKTFERRQREAVGNRQAAWQQQSELPGLIRPAPFRSDEQLVFKGGEFISPSKQAEFDKKAKEIREQRQELRQKYSDISWERDDLSESLEYVKDKIEEQKKKEPKVFGRKSWEAALRTLEEKRGAVDNLQSELVSFRKLVNDMRFSLPLKPNLLGSFEAQGTKEEIANAIRARLEEVGNKKASPEAEALHAKYVGLAKQLDPGN